MVTAADCPAGSIFVGTDSADAVWAVSAQTGAYCTKKQGNIIHARGEGGDCLMKYHAFTGLPIWAVVLPDVTSIAPTPDGTLHATGSDEGLAFGAIQTPETCSFGCERIWHAIIDGTTGFGLSVQSYGPVEPATTNPYDMTLTSDGDVCLLAYAAGTSIRFDDNFTMTWPEENRAQGDFYGQVALFKVATSGTKIKPSCISTCTSDASTTVIEANSCYIDGICYADGDGVPEFTQSYADGNLCQICDVTQSQTSWSDDLTIVGVSECFIDGVCYKGNYSGVDADWFSYIPGASSANLPEGALPASSLCQYCDPTKDKNAWSVADGYVAVPGMNPPNDCQLNVTRVNTGESDGANTLSRSGLSLYAAALASLAAILLP